MQIDLRTLMAEPYVLMFAAVFTGLVFGRLRIGQFIFGLSGTMFTGLGIGWWIYHRYAAPFASLYAANPADPDIPPAALQILRGGVVGKEFFTIFLILFVASVGLLAARELGVVIRRFGLKFVILGVVVTLTGAAAVYAMVQLSPGQNPFAVAGVYTGALTSSPGLGAAIEATSRFGKEAQAMVGAGYAITYPFGVLIVILGIQFLPRLFSIDIEAEKRAYAAEMQLHRLAGPVAATGEGFDLAALAVIGILGYLLGSITVNLGPLGRFGLGSTGGILLTALFLGYLGRIGPLNFRMEPRILAAIRDVALVFFLAVTGLRYGFKVIDALVGGGGYLVLVALVAGTLAMLVGFAVGRWWFRINWVLLAGALCGGMTSTPGLGAAIDAVGSDGPAAGYGATYPSALLGMVLFTVLLYSLPL